MLRIWAHQFLEWHPFVVSSQVLSVPKDNLTNFSKHARHFGGFLSATWHWAIDFRIVSEVFFWVLSVSSEFSIMSAWFILVFSKCITSHWTSPADFWSAQFYDVLLEVLAIEGIGVEGKWHWSRTENLLSSTGLQISLFITLSRPQMNILTKTGPSNNLHSERLSLLRAIHWFLSSKKFSSNPMATKFL